jgi:ABC-type branched-subunit amino acid transport system permease subunit
VSSRGEWGPASSRRLPPLILLLLAAVAVALSPALGARSGYAGADVFGSAAFPATGDEHAGVAADEHQGTDRAPLRAGLRHAPARATALERPTFDAVLPGAALAGPLLALIVGYGGNERRHGRAVPSASARGPPALSA